MTDGKVIYEQGFTAKGTELLTAGDLLASLDYLIDRGAYPQSIEAYEIIGGDERLILAFSLLGLDKELNNDPEPRKIIEAVRRKVLEATKHEHEVKFQMWLDEITDK